MTNKQDSLLSNEITNSGEHCEMTSLEPSEDRAGLSPYRVLDAHLEYLDNA